MKNIFEIKKVVSNQDIDNLNHVNNVVFVKWMEEIAEQHWSFLTKDNPLSQFVWVVLRHEIDYLKEAKLGDTITVKTWVGESKGFKSERFISFYKDHVKLVTSKTIWGMLNAKTFKPVRISEKVLNIMQGNK